MRAHLASAAILLMPAAADAADTFETWDPGVPAFEIYAGADGITGESGEGAVFVSPLLWIGLVDRLSAFVATDLAATTELRDPGLGVSAFLLATVLETDVVDLDLFLGAQWSGPAPAGLTVRPAIELNVDASPDMSTWGLYLRLDAPVVGPLTAAEDPEVFLEGVLGAYGSVAAGHELHVALSGALGPLSDAEGDPGAVALGYNVLLTDTLELISEVSFGIPLSGEPFSVGVVVGLIASLPTGGDTEDPANPAN